VITLKRLEANNFKSLRSVTLAFPERGNVLIEGHNEAGKSTLFEAVYVALYGKPLVGEDAVARRDEVIQHGQSRATVRLIFNIGQQELTIERMFERGKSQQAILTIQRPGVQPEMINRVRAVDERILKELGNLDGDSLRNSCFVEQKELGRIEALSLGQREQAIQKLLGLERLTQLMEQFKFRREQERELTLAQSYVKLAQLQAEVLAAAAEEAELAQRLDAVRVASQVKRLTDLGVQKEEAEKRLGACMVRAQEARKRLNRCATLKENGGRCDQAASQITDISHARTELDRVAEGLARLDSIERVELPQARVYLGDVFTAAEAVAQTARAREQVQEAEEAVREAQRHIKELEQAVTEYQRKEEELSHAQLRGAQRHKEAEAERQRIAQRLDELEAKRVRLGRALALVGQWEAAREQLQAIQQEISASESRQQELTTLHMEMQRREDQARGLEAGVARAEQEMQKAADAVRLATAFEALTAWVRLKGVEMALSGYTTQHTELLNRCQEAETAFAAARTKARAPLFVGIALAVLTIVALILGVLWFPAFALFAVFLGGAIASWLWFFRARKRTQQRSDALSRSRLELQRLDMQRQAAIQTGGDPAMLVHCEQQLLTTGLAVPSGLEAGRTLLEEQYKRLGSMQGQHPLQEIAQNTRDTHIRLAEQLKQAQSVAEASRRDWYRAQQSGDQTGRLSQLQTQAAQQESIVATNEESARQSIGGDGQWPTRSNALQTLVSTCQAELRAAGEAQGRQELTSARLIQEAKADEEKAEVALRQAREVVDAQKSSNPVAQLSGARENLAEAEMLYRQREEATRLLLRKVHLQTETEAEPERGRAEARVQTLERELATRPLRQEEYTTRKAGFTDSLTATSTKIGSFLIALHGLAMTGLPSLPQMPNNDDTSFPYERLLTATLSDIRKALQTTLVTLDEQGTRNMLDVALGEQGKIKQQKDVVDNDMQRSQQVIDAIFSSRRITHPSAYTYDDIVACWSLAAQVSPDEEGRVAENLERTSRHLYAARQQESQLATELRHPSTPLNVEECQQKVAELLEEREICALATRLLRETHDRIARRVLPITERNMQPLLQQLTGGRYRDVRLTPEETNGQPGEMDYRIRVWDPAAGRYVAKNLFSGGTRDQCSLALRLAFALATLPQELGVAPGFIFLDEPLSAFDAQRAQSLVELITVGTIAQQFNQVVLISHQHAFDREAFQYHVRMEAGQVIESDLLRSEYSDIEPDHLQLISAGSE
jgi:DNA repair exonuclease SbcCD ATPase subunit